MNNEIFRIHHAEWMSLLIITSAKDNIMAEAKIFTFSNRFWVSLAGPNIRPRKLYPGYSLTCKGSQPQPHQELLLYILWIYTCTHTKYIRDNWCSHRFKNTDICSSSQYVNSVLGWVVSNLNKSCLILPLLYKVGKARCLYVSKRATTQKEMKALNIYIVLTLKFSRDANRKYILISGLKSPALQFFKINRHTDIRQLRREMKKL